MIKVRINRLRPGATIPNYMSAGSAGCDVSACLDKPLVIHPGDRVAVPTGLAVEIPEGFEIQVRPRSGLALGKGLTVVNAPGTIDSDYRGEIKILLINLGDQEAEISHGDRIAQIILKQVERIQWDEVAELNCTVRGTGGMGSTGC